VLLLGGLELILSRYVSLPSSPGIPEYQTNRYIRLREYRPHSSMVLVPSETRLNISDGLENKQYPLNIDAHGFVAPSIVHEHPDVTLVFLGGSTTECAYVSETKRFPFLVGQKLETMTQKTVNSINAGVRANTSLNSIDGFVNKVLPLHPQIAVLMHNINDLVMLLYEGTYWGSQQSDRSPVVELDLSPQGQPTLRTVAADSLQVFIPHLTQAVRNLRKRVGNTQEADEFSHINAEHVEINDAYITYMMTEFKKNLSMFIGICQARNILPVLMTQANRFKEHPDRVIIRHFEQLIQKRKLHFDYQELRSLHERFNEVIREVGEMNEVLVIDLATQIPQEKTFIADAVHLNDTGSKLAAEMISQQLFPEISVIIKKGGNID